MHNGTIEYTSRDAHNGVPTMRSDLEILAYNIVHWSGITLPWEAEGLLTVPKKVQESKENFMSDVVGSLKKCFPNCPESIINYFKYVATLKYNDTPDYEKCRQIFETALKKLGESNSGELKFKLSPIAGTSKKTTTKQSNKDDAPVEQRKRSKKMQNVDENESDSASSEVENKSPIKKPATPRKRVIAHEATSSRNDKRPKITSKTGTENTASSVVVNLPPKVKSSKNSKTYNLNFDLDISLDANIVISVNRKPKEGRGKAGKVSKPNSLEIAPSQESDDDEVIPNSNENTPIAKVRVLKNKTGTPKKTTRKSPRSAL